MAEYEGYLSALKKGTVGRLSPGPSETPLGISMRISRAGARTRKPLVTWVDAGIDHFRHGG